MWSCECFKKQRTGASHTMPGRHPASPPGRCHLPLLKGADLPHVALPTRPALTVWVSLSQGPTVVSLSVLLGLGLDTFHTSGCIYSCTSDPKSRGQRPACQCPSLHGPGLGLTELSPASIQASVLSLRVQTLVPFPAWVRSPLVGVWESSNEH